MEDEPRFKRLDRLLFQRRELTKPERWLGLAVLGLLLLGAWLIFWPLLPTIISNLVLGVINLFSSAASPAPTPGPVLAPDALPSPSPSPLPAPSPLPSPSPFAG